jgi:hypothetical protein
MAKTVSAEGERCSSPGLHNRVVRRLEIELVESWTAGAELHDDWEILVECIPGWSTSGGSALLSTYWTDMPCGCVFGALQVVYLDPADASLGGMA